jgi:isoquinoline 1-oxidoreductase beta subunit
MAQLFPQGNQRQPDAVDGAAQLPYSVPNILVDYVMVNTAVPVGWWRSVYHSQNAFVNECFLDEIAAAVGADPYEFRRRLLPATAGSRLRGTLELAADKAGWVKPLAKGRARGIACHASFGSFFAEVAEVSVDKTGKVRVHKVVCALDCGPVVNPDTIAAQIEGAIAFGLSAALKGEITIARGRVQQGNFDDYPILTFAEMPEVEVQIVPSTDALGGIGEPGLPPIAPAVCNAIFAATGKRLRRLPIRSEDLK